VCVLLSMDKSALEAGESASLYITQQSALEAWSPSCVYITQHGEECPRDLRVCQSLYYSTGIRVPQRQESLPVCVILSMDKSSPET
jgi:hypothetical protein